MGGFASLCCTIPRASRTGSGRRADSLARAAKLDGVVGHFRLHPLGLLGRAPLYRPHRRRADELPEQRRRASGARLELRMELRGDVERVIGELDYLHEALVRRGSTRDQALVLEPPSQHVVDLVAVAMALIDHRLAVDLASARSVVELYRVGAEPHRATHVRDLLLLG